MSRAEYPGATTAEDLLAVLAELDGDQIRCLIRAGARMARTRAGAADLFARRLTQLDLAADALAATAAEVRASAAELRSLSGARHT